MEVKVSDSQEARRRIEELIPEIYRTLNNWSLEPSWQRAASDWTAIFSEYLDREADYRRLLEERLGKLEERVAALEE